MKELQNLSAMLQEMDDLLITCMKCGLCQGVCPVFAETQLEGDVTRGKLYLLEGLAGQLISDVKGVNEQLDRCLLCGTCAANCPSGVNVLEIFILARSILTDFSGLSVFKKVVFRGLVSRPRLFDRILNLSHRFQGLLLSPANPKIGTYCSRILSAFIGDRHFIPLADRSFTSTLKKTQGNPCARLKVTLFPGCVVDKIFPQIAEKTVQILNKNSVNVVIPREQVCCGIPALASGDAKTFERLYHRNLDLFLEMGGDYLLTPCATCTSTIKKIWPMMDRNLKLGRGKTVKKLADITMDISEFLVDVLKVEPVPINREKGKRVTYHDPCHLAKSLKVRKQPRSLLTAHKNLEFVEMTDADACCGNGGSFNLKHYKTSMKIGSHKCQHIIETGADMVVTSCPACIMQLSDLLSQAQQTVEVRHVIELFDDVSWK